MTTRQKRQIDSLVGKKVTVYFCSKKIQRVLHRDIDGLYIRYKGQRVSCRPDLNTLDILFFITREPRR